MNSILCALLAVFSAVFAMPALAAGEPALAQSICILGSNNDCACGLPPDNVLTADNTEIYAKASIISYDKAPVEFMWFSPDGSVARRSVKAAFYNKNDGRFDAWDSVLHNGIEGWWRVEAGYEGGKLSKEFLVTKNRRVVTLISGNKAARIAVIRGVNPSGNEGRDIIDIAMQDQDWDVRAAALTRIVDVGEGWAMQDVRLGLEDRDARVRLAALKAADILAGPERKAAYLDALGSTDPATRLEGVRGLHGFDDDEALEALKGVLMDPVPELRLASLKRLAALDAPGLDARIKGLVNDIDHAVAAEALAVVLGLEDGPSKSGGLVAAALSDHKDLARKALDELLGTGGAEALPALMRHFRDGYRMADDLSAMVSVGSGEAVPYIEEAYRISGPDEVLKRMALRGLSGKGVEAWGLVEYALKDPSAQVRLEALETARTLPGRPGRTPMLRTALADNVPDVRARALDLLAETGTAEAYAAMTDALGDPVLRDTALQRITGSGVPGVTEMLAEKGLTVADDKLRRMIVDKLAGRVQADAVMPYMDDKEPSVRAEAAKAIGTAGGAEAACRLYKAGSDPAHEVWFAARTALEGMSGSELSAGLALLFDRGDADAATAGFIANAVTDSATLELLVKMIPASDAGMLRAALEPIAAQKGDRLIHVVAEGLKTTDSELAWMLVSRLSGSGSPAARDALEGIYRNRPELRELLLSASTGKLVSVGMIKLALADENAGIRNKAVGAVGGLPEDTANQLLALSGQDPDPGVRLETARVAGRLGIASALSSASRDRDAAVRSASAEGFAGLGGKAAMDGLVALSMDKEPSVSAAAVSGLAGLHADVPLSAWARIAAGAARLDARLAAIDALGRSGNKKAAGPLARAMAADDPNLADAAETAMAALGRDGLADLYPLLGPKNTRARALRLLGRLAEPASEPRIIAVLPKLGAKEMVMAIDTLGRLGGRKSLDAMARIYPEAGEGLRTAILRAAATLDVKGGEPGLKKLISYGLGSEVDDIRFYAVRAAGARRVVSLKARLTGMLESEGSVLVRRELERVLRAL